MKGHKLYLYLHFRGKVIPTASYLILKFIRSYFGHSNTLRESRLPDDLNNCCRININDLQYLTNTVLQSRLTISFVFLCKWKRSLLNTKMCHSEKQLGSSYVLIYTTSCLNDSPFCRKWIVCGLLFTSWGKWRYSSMFVYAATVKAVSFR